MRRCLSRIVPLLIAGFFAVPARAVVPSAVTNLTAATSSQVGLTWTSPVNINSAASPSYDIRYSTFSSIDIGAQFSSAIQISSVPVPAVSGTTEYWTVTGLKPGVTYWWAIESSNASGTSLLDTSSPRPYARPGSFVLYQEPAGPVGPGDGGVAWGDYDNDGDLDLLVNGLAGGSYKPRVYRNDAGNFVLAFDPSTGAGIGGVAWGDYDKDGDLDFVASGYDNGTGTQVQVYRNDAGSFVLVQVATSSFGIAGGGTPAWGDYDNDGDLDIAVNWDTGFTSRFQLYRNDSGTFNLVQEPAGASAPGDGAVAWGDYDNDGDLDLAVNGYDGTGYRFRVYRNDGGTFNLVQEPAGATGPGQYGSVAWGDYDNDGDLDLAVTGHDGAGNRFRVYRNDSGTFNLVQEPSGATGPGSGAVAWGDYDNDGDLDLAVNGSDGVGRRFRVYRNDAGTFNLVQEPAGATGPGNGVAWGDFDGDGDLDLAVNGTDGSGNRFRIYKSLEADYYGANAAPTTPSAGFSTAIDAQRTRVELRWNAGSDATTATNGLNYAIRITTAAGVYNNSNSLKVAWAPATPFLGNYAHGFAVAATTGPGFNFKPGAVNTTYYWQVAAVDTGLKQSGWSVEQSTNVDLLPPAVPSGFGVADVPADQGFTLRLSWAADTESDLKDYGVYRATFTGPLGNKTLITRILSPGTTYQDTGLTNGVWYPYQITARDTNHNESTGSVEQSATPVDNLAPAAPAGLGVSSSVGGASSGDRLSLSWSANPEPDLKDYRVRRTTFVGVGLANPVVATVTQPGTTHQDGGLANGATYYYRLSARDVSLNESLLSGEVSASPADTMAPSAVTNLVAAAQAQILLTWTAPAEDGTAGGGAVSSYLIRSSTFGPITVEADWSTATVVAGAGLPAPLSPGTTQTYVVTGLKPRTTYWFAVKSQDAAGNVSALDTSTPKPSASAGSFVLAQEPSGATGPGQYGMVAWGDYDNDGDLDLAVNGTDDGTNYRFRVYRNDSGTFNLVQEPSGATGPGAGAVAWGDFDRDGDLDLAVNGSDGVGYRFRVYRNDAGTFNLVQEPAGAAGPSGGVAWGDYDNDGDLDLAVNGWDGTAYRFRVYRNDAGTFNLVQEPAGATGPGSGAVAWGDYDNDGDLDLAVNGDDGTGLRFRVYRNDAGTFNLAQEPAGATGPGNGAVAWGDYDNDGDLDLAVNGWDGVDYRFRVYRNDAGTFNLVQEPAGATGPSEGAVAWGDFDNDGDLDLSVNGSDGVGNRFRVYRNDAGTFNLVQEPAGTTGPGGYGAVAWGDYDNDGDLDLAVNGYDGAGYRFRVYKSLEADFYGANPAPSPPAGGFSTAIDAARTRVELRWSAGADSAPGATPANGLYYLARVSTQAGVYTSSASLKVAWKPASPFLGNYAHGFAVAATTGPGVNYKPGAVATTFYWQVASIDAGLRQSATWSVEQSTFVDLLSPAAPSGPGVSNTAAGGTVGGRLTLSWTADTEADLKEYRLRRTTFVGVGAADPVAATIAKPGTTHQDVGLTNGTTFYYRIAARDTNLNESGLSSEVSAYPFDGPPAAPTGFGLSDPGTTVLNLSWLANVESDMKDYRVYRSTNVGVTLVSSHVAVAIASPGTTHQDAGLTVGRRYNYQLTARDVGLNESGGSGEIWSVPGAPAAPAAPGAADAPLDQGFALRLSWTANTEADLKDYGMYRATWAGASPAPTPTRILSPGTTHQDAGLTNGTTFYFRLTARDTSLNESGYSTEMSAFPVDNLAPAAPAGLGAANAGTGGRINLSWTASPEPDLRDYRVFRTTSTSGVVLGSSWTVFLTAVLAPGTTHQDPGLTDGVAYTYRITARDVSANESGLSASASATPADITPPAIPSGVGAADVPSDEGFALRVSWTANTEGDLKDYGVYRATWAAAGPVPTRRVAFIAAPGTTYQEAGLTNGTTYYYQVTARDAPLNESGGSTDVSAFPFDNTAPSAPGGLAAIALDTRINLAWTAGVEPDLRDYRLYRSTNAGVTQVSSHVLVAVLVPGTTHQDAGLQNGPTYYYRLSARDLAVNESSLSVEISSRASPDTVPPSSPTGLFVVWPSTDQGTRVHLYWTANPEIDLKDYEIYRATISGVVGTKALLTRIAVPGTTHQETGLIIGTTYYYQLEARDFTLNRSAGSSEASGYPRDNVPPVAPAGVTISKAGSGRLAVGWTANTEGDLGQYRVRRAITAGQPWTGMLEIATVTAPGASYEDSGLGNETTYYYRVAARDASGNESLPSAEVSGIPSLPPAAPIVTAISPPSGRNTAATTVTITGSNYISVSKVELLTDPPTVLSASAVSEAQISATVPAGLAVGMYRVRVTAAGGVTTSGAAFSVLLDERATQTLTVTEQAGSVRKARAEVPPQSFSVPVVIDIGTTPVTVEGSKKTAADAAAKAGGAGVILLADLDDTLREIRVLDSAGTATKPGGKVTLIIPYNAAAVKDYQADALRVMRLNPQTAAWDLAAPYGDQKVVKADGVVRCPVSSFSVFRLGVAFAPAAALDGVQVYPNPADLSQAGALVRWKDLSSNATIEIFDASGELVVKMEPAFKTATGSDNPGTTGRAAWDGRNADGNPVAGGLYFVSITDPAGGKKTMKLAVKR